MIPAASVRWVTVSALGLLVLVASAGCVGEAAPRPPAPEAPGGSGPGVGGTGGGGRPGAGGRAGAPDPPGSAGGTGGETSDTNPPPEPPPPAPPPPADAAQLGDAGPQIDGAPSPVDGADAPAGAMVWARDVRLALIEAGQGPFVRLGQGTTVVPLAMRNAPLIEGRPLFVRVHVATGPGFSPRPLRGVLTVEQGQDRQDQKDRREIEDSKMIAGPSDSTRLPTTFNFLVPAESMKPGSRLSVGLYEAAGGALESPEPATPPRFPATGAVDLGVKGGRMVLDLVLVPAIGVGGPIDDSPARRKTLENHLYDVYPVQKLNVRWRAPLRFATRISAAEGFAALAEARTADDARPNEYYHLMIAQADTREAYLGIAQLVGASAREGARRIGITFLNPRVADASVDSTSHEIGHNHGRNHAPNCGAGGPDPSYPYGNGALGVDGISLSEGVLYPRQMRFDIMGYCSPTWISDYTWRGFEQRVRAVSAFAASPGTMALADRSLQGFLSPGEPPHFAVVAGSLTGSDTPAPSATRRARITLADGTTHDARLSLRTLSDDRTREIAIDLPAEGEIRAVEVIVDGARFDVPRSVLGRL